MIVPFELNGNQVYIDSNPGERLVHILRQRFKLLGSKEVIDRLASLGAEPLAMTPDEFAAMVKKDIAKWSEAVETSGARVD